MPLPERSADLVLVVGERLAATRRALELTQEQLAEQVGVSRGALGNWEQGTRLPDPATMLRLRQRYGVTLDWIYGGDPSGLPQRLASKILGRTSIP
ncbi:MAG: helix-turn-helix transcriptional regulator [Geminicoccaceae bacterium]|nr:helix-turn-helix transcriptional regulator [Geminicoccaceae bacterium]MCB9943872.1 helix-turn-helix transcriptional regulator [Geminicoccaceae bacterium]